MKTKAIWYCVELANKIEKGRAVGNLYGVGRYVDGCRQGYVLSPQSDEDFAEQVKQALDDGIAIPIMDKPVSK